MLHATRPFLSNISHPSRGPVFGFGRVTLMLAIALWSVIEDGVTLMLILYLLNFPECMIL